MPSIGELLSAQGYGLYKNVTSSVVAGGNTIIKTGTGTLQGVIINSHISATIQFSDALTSTTPQIGGTITLGASERFIPFFGAKFTTGLFITATGSANLTIVYN